MLTIFWPWASKTRGTYEKLRNAIAGRHRDRGGDVLHINSCWFTALSTSCDGEQLPSCDAAQHPSRLYPFWPACSIYYSLWLLLSSCALFQRPLPLNYEKADNRVWDQKVFILPGFTGLTLSGPLRSFSLFSLTLNNSHHRHLVWTVRAPAHHLCVTVLCPHPQCTI